MVENPVATDTGSISGSGESGTFRLEIGEPDFYGDGIAEVDWSWSRVSGEASIANYTIELRQGGSVIDSFERTAGLRGGTTSGSGTLSGPATGGQPVSVVFVGDGADLLSVSAQLPSEPVQRGIVLDVGMLTEGPYPERPGLADPPQYPRYRVTVTNNDPGVSPPAEIDLRYPTEAGSFGPQLESKTVTLGLNETASFEVEYTGRIKPRHDDERYVEVVRVRDSSGTRVTDQGFSITAPVPLGEPEFFVRPRDVNLSGDTQTIALTPGKFGYTGPGGEIPQETSVSAANESDVYGIPYRLVVRAVNVDRGEEVVGVDVTGSIPKQTDLYLPSDYSIPWPESWALPFTLRFVRELYILEQPHVDPDTPFVTNTGEIEVPPEDNDNTQPAPGDGDDDGGTEPEPDPPVTQPAIPTLSIECAFGGAQITAGEPVTIPATVTTGSGQGEATGTVTFELAGATATKTVRLGPNSSTTVEATFEVTEPGGYTPEVTVE